MSGVSLLSQLNAQLSRFDTLNTQFSDLQRSLSSNKKSTTYKGLGEDSLSSLRYRTSLSASDKYMSNIDVASTRLKTMDTSLNLIQKQVSRLQTGIIQQPLDGESDISSLTSYAAKLVEIMPSNLNQNIDGQYVFAGSDVDAIPFTNLDTLEGLVQDDVSDWLDGTIDTDTFLSRIEAYTDDEVGFTPEVLSAGNIKVTADDDYKVDYTVKASDASVKKILVASVVLKNLTVPDPDTDAPSFASLKTVVLAMGDKLDSGAAGLESHVVGIKADIGTLGEVRQRHQFDKEALQGLIDDVENVDVTETAVKLQNVQLQLEASYRVTSVTADLTLLNYLNN